MTTLPGRVRTSSELRTLKIGQQGSLLSIELNTPEQGNVVSDALLDDLLLVLERQSPAIRVIVLSGAGDDFSLGGDRSEYMTHLRVDPAGSGIRASGMKALRICQALSANPAVTIARVQGRAIGAGLALALACDLRIGGEESSFRLPELGLGLPTAWGGLLPRLIHEAGAARARDLILTGRVFSADEALACSILQRTVPTADLDAAVEVWARPLMRRSGPALRITKALLNSYAAATRLADPAMLDPEVMAAVAAETLRASGGAR
ncbi:enoyl-CoA hydratase/isomerase family protein [Streptomyces misionensis]|uniref:enoyl-CoA hydratase/isomerase family protein n=1 Tax=Streptomyces misionensis TaxID=67331 RepID=UPI003697D9B7